MKHILTDDILPSCFQVDLQEGGFQFLHPNRYITWQSDGTCSTVPRQFRYLLRRYSLSTVKSKLGIENLVELGILRLALLTKGAQFTLNQLLLRYNHRNRPPVTLVRKMMFHLADLGLGVIRTKGRMTQFIKMNPMQIDRDLLAFCSVSHEQYTTNYYI